MNTNYNTFSYNSDFTPIYNVFNINNDRFIGIGTHIPNKTVNIIGNVSTSNLLTNKNIFYNNNTTKSHINLLQIDSNNTIITPNLVSSNYEETGTEWTIVNNNNIKLTLRNINDNTRLHYLSEYYPITSNICNINVYVKSTLTLKSIYFITTQNDFISNADIDDINTSNIIISVNNIQSTLNNSNTAIFKLSNYITLENNKLHTITISKLNSSTNLNNFQIQLIGTYDYYAGSLWDKYPNQNNVTILKNIGIGTTTPSCNLDIIGNTTISQNLNINNNLNVYTFNTNTLNVINNTNITNIESIQHNLNITTNKLLIGVSTYLNDDYINFGNNFKIKSNQNIIFNNLNTNYINFNNNIGFISNNSSIFLNNSTNIIYKLNNKTILDDKNNNLNLYSNLILDNKIPSLNNNKLYVNGNVNILGNLTTNYNGLITYNPKLSQINNKLITNSTIVNNLYSDSFLYTDTLETTTIDIIKTFKLPTQINNNNIHNYPYIYYNLTTNNYMIFDGTLSKIINTTTSLIDFSNVAKIFTQNASNITFINSKNVITNILENNKVLNLNNCNIFYNVNNSKEEIIIDNNVKYFDLF